MVNKYTESLIFIKIIYPVTNITRNNPNLHKYHKSEYPKTTEKSMLQLEMTGFDNSKYSYNIIIIM